jgi:hypothetical protein
MRNLPKRRGGQGRAFRPLSLSRPARQRSRIARSMRWRGISRFALAPAASRIERINLESFCASLWRGDGAKLGHDLPHEPRRHHLLLRTRDSAQATPPESPRQRVSHLRSLGPHPEAPSRLARASKDDPACAGVRAHWSVLRGRFAAPLDGGRWRQAISSERRSLIAIESVAIESVDSEWFGQAAVDSELTCPVLVAHQLSASSAFVLLWECGQRVSVVHISTGAPPSGFRRRFFLP